MVIIPTSQSTSSPKTTKGITTNKPNPSLLPLKEAAKYIIRESIRKDKLSNTTHQPITENKKNAPIAARTNRKKQQRTKYLHPWFDAFLPIRLPGDFILSFSLPFFTIESFLK